MLPSTRALEYSSCMESYWDQRAGVPCTSAAPGHVLAPATTQGLVRRRCVHAVLHSTPGKRIYPDLYVPAFLWGLRRKKLRPQGRGENVCLGRQEGMLTSGGYVGSVPALGWCFLCGRGWVFLYLGQDFCAKLCLMSKPPGLPSKPVPLHDHFLWTGKQYVCESPFLMCLFFSLSPSPSFFFAGVQPDPWWLAAACPAAPGAGGGACTHRMGLRVRRVHVHFS